MQFLAAKVKSVSRTISNLIQQVARKKKIIIVKGWSRFNYMQRHEYEHLQYDELERIARNDIVFPLACFLIGAGEYAYFCYSWGHRDTDGG